jgi:peptidoglycan/LPS O-acetylase OafA/YrhL
MSAPFAAAGGETPRNGTDRHTHLTDRPDEIPFRLGYRPELDGLRALATLAVVMGHFSLFGAGVHLTALDLSLNPIRGGFFGLDIFFVLSGFLITALLLQEHIASGSINLWHFFARRALRLLPGLTMFLAVWLVYAACSPVPSERKLILRGTLLALCFGVNSYYCITGNHLGMLTHLWSLSLEEKFYFIWAVLLCGLLWFRVSRRQIVLLTFFGAVGAALLRFACWQTGAPLGLRMAASSLVGRFDAILAGALVAMLACWNGLPRSRGGQRVLRAGCRRIAPRGADHRLQTWAAFVFWRLLPGCRGNG